MSSVLEELHGLARNTVLLLAVRTEDEIRRHSALMRAYSTVVIGLGLGPRSWSLAKIQGASGYVHDSAGYTAAQALDPGQLAMRPHQNIGVGR